jgi:hypothetical protein
MKGLHGLNRSGDLMSTIDRRRVAAVRKLEAMGYTFAAGFGLRLLLQR